MGQTDILLRLLKRCKYTIKGSYIPMNIMSSSLCTMVQRPVSKNLLKICGIGLSVGVLGGIGYSLMENNRKNKYLSMEGTEKPLVLLDFKPNIQPSRKVISPVDSTGLKLTLYQYQTCPFCCKVRTFLDYYGLSYDIVEVNPVLRKEISWSAYRKVPILLAKADKGYQSLNDSSMIISLLASHVGDKTQKIDELAKFYPSIGIHDDHGTFKHEIMNKYFLMYQNHPNGKTMNDLVEERKWRKWADDVFVHVLSPNVYRTIGESYDTFNWFSETGKWDDYFSAWERILVINVGACAMWLIGKRLKKKHHLKDDVRQSFYEEINYWLRAIQARGTQFMGGQNPDLSDLAVYGVLNSIEGCQAFKDALNSTNLAVWYNAVKEKVETHSGSIYLNS